MILTFSSVGASLEEVEQEARDTLESWSEAKTIIQQMDSLHKVKSTNESQKVILHMRTSILANAKFIGEAYRTLARVPDLYCVSRDGSLFLLYAQARRQWLTQVQPQEREARNPRCDG